MLSKLLQHKQEKVNQDKKQLSISHLENNELFQRKCLSLKQNILCQEKLAVICEFKRGSPSQGTFDLKANPVEIVADYQSAGAVGISILTEDKYFYGSLADITLVRAECSLPILNKDFIIDEYQLWQAKAAGSDIVLLIAAILDQQQIGKFTQQAHALGLEVLIEFHEASELIGLDLSQFDLIGVNNRNLGTLAIDTNVCLQLVDYFDPNTQVLIAESGFDLSDNLAPVKAAGYQALLVGTAFMSSDDSEKAKKLISNLP